MGKWILTSIESVQDPYCKGAYKRICHCYCSKCKENVTFYQKILVKTEEEAKNILEKDKYYLLYTYENGDISYFKADKFCKNCGTCIYEEDKDEDK